MNTMVGESGYKRKADDFYRTPPWVTAALVVRHGLHIVGPVWEPACGDGAMSRVLGDLTGESIHSTDKVDRGFGNPGVDFLTTHLTNCRSIITNPPYSYADEFISHALSFIPEGVGMIAMLLRNEYDSARTREKFFKECPYFYTKLVLTTRPQWIEGITKASPRHNFAWFIWHGGIQIDPLIEWISRKEAEEEARGGLGL